MRKISSSILMCLVDVELEIDNLPEEDKATAIIYLMEDLNNMLININDSSTDSSLDW